MEKLERLEYIFNTLRNKGLVHTKYDFANKLDYNYSSLCSAMRGDERFLTEPLMTRVATAYLDVFDAGWVLTGKGEPLKSNILKSASEAAEAEELRRDIKSLKAIIETQQKEIEWLRNTISSSLK